MSGLFTSTSLYTSMAWTGETLPFILYRLNAILYKRQQKMESHN
jgi:hypothetical protein